VGSFSGICLELGLGLAIGMLAGTAGTHGSARGRMTILAGVIALVIGALLAGSANVNTAAGAIFCLVGAVFACVVVSDVVSSASRRKGSGAGALSFLVSLAALVVVAIAILISPAILLIVAALAWLGISRRRRARRKHAGLRVLR
jgi:chromate transport protein ChrA